RIFRRPSSRHATSSSSPTPYSASSPYASSTARLSRSARGPASSSRCSGSCTMRKWVIGSAIVFALVLVGAGVSLSLAWRFLSSPMQIDEPQVFVEVPSGTPLYRLSARLAERGLLSHPRILTWYGRLTGDATRIHAGEYRLTPGTTPIALIEKLVSGQVHLHQLTIIEGWRFADLL